RATRGQFCFVHDLLRQAARAALPPESVRARHAAWGHALRLRGDHSLSDAARHLFAADSEGTSALAAEGATEAARGAMARLAYEDAVDLLERAVASHERAARERPLIAALTALAHARFDAGDAAGSVAAAQRALVLARTSGGPELVATAALALGR